MAVLGSPPRPAYNLYGLCELKATLNSNRQFCISRRKEKKKSRILRPSLFILFYFYFFIVFFLFFYFLRKVFLGSGRLPLTFLQSATEIRKRDLWGSWRAWRQSWTGCRTPSSGLRTHRECGPGAAPVCAHQLSFDTTLFRIFGHPLRSENGPRQHHTPLELMGSSQSMLHLQLARSAGGPPIWPGAKAFGW